MMDAQLLSDFLSHRDESAFETLVARHGPMVLRVCRDILGDPNDAEDAFQATFLVLVRRAGAIRDRSSLGPWLYEVALRISRRARGHAAKQRAKQRQVLSMDKDASSVPPPDPAQQELRPILHDEIDRLPSKFRDAIVLCYLEDFTVEGAARRLDCPVGTLKSRLTRGREMLRSRLVRRGLTTSAVMFLMFRFSDAASAASSSSAAVGAVGDEVPVSLVKSTVKAGMHAADQGLGRAGVVSARVAAMVREELAVSRRVGALVVVAMLLSFVALSSAGLSGGIRAAAVDPTNLKTSRGAAWYMLIPAALLPGSDGAIKTCH